MRESDQEGEFINAHDAERGSELSDGLIEKDGVAGDLEASALISPSRDSELTDRILSDPVSDDFDFLPAPSKVSNYGRWLTAIMLVLGIGGLVYAMLSVMGSMGEMPTNRERVDSSDSNVSYEYTESRGERVVEYDGSFDVGDYVKKQDLVVMELKTSWCSYCKEFESRLGDVLKSDDRVRVLLVDVEKYAEFGKRYDVVGTPTFVKFEGGEITDRRIGSMTTVDFVNWLKE